MIFAAGLGTRFKPWTDHHPKALAVVNGKSLLQRNIEYLQRAGITEVVVNVHHFAQQIIDAVNENNGWGSFVTISDESESVLETGGGLMHASRLLDSGPLVIVNVDVLTDLDLNAMILEHERGEALATIAVSDRVTSRYFLFDKQMRLCGWRNKQSGDEKIVRPYGPFVEKAFSGVHVVQPKIFDLITRQGKFSMVDVYLDLANGNLINGYDHTGSKFIDVGKPGSVTLAEELFM